MSKIGVMVCGHGSRDPEAISEFSAVAAGIAQRLPQFPVASGFLEFARPVIRDGLDSLRERGVSRILAVPGMLFAAGHVKDDIPSVLNTWQARHGVRVDYGRDLGLDPKLLRAAGRRIEEAEARAPRPVPREESLLVVVGRGTSDPDANSNIAKVARMLGEGMGFGWTEVCYSGVTFPLVAPGLEHAVRLGYRRIIVFPYFLFTGVLVKRIYRITDAFAARFPAIEFLKASYLNDHPLVLDAFADRVQGILAGDNAMNCQQCKYREQVLGFEAAVGAPQFSHHHHVEGIGTDADRAGQIPATGEADGHPHDHHHHHHHGHHDHHHDHHDGDHLHDHDGHHAHGHDHDHHHHHHHHHRLPHPHPMHPHGPGRRDPDAA
ncbi:MAG: sirohydrochlorin chelatase [Rhodospirillaceae bacterium]|nr:sirohydrochlorin chelatase [Rhodospirillaceae bacterium]